MCSSMCHLALHSDSCSQGPVNIPALPGSSFMGETPLCSLGWGAMPLMWADKVLSKGTHVGVYGNRIQSSTFRSLKMGDIIYLIIYFVCVYYGAAPCGGQRSTVTLFLSSHQVSGLKLRLPGLFSSCLYTLSHLAFFHCLHFLLSQPTFWTAGICHALAVGGAAASG